MCCGSGSARIRTFLVGSGSGRLRPDPDLDPGLKYDPISTIFVCVKTINTLGSSVS
jgi:hypothetical protein